MAKIMLPQWLSARPAGWLRAADWTCRPLPRAPPQSPCPGPSPRSSRRNASGRPPAGPDAGTRGASRRPPHSANPSASACRAGDDVQKRNDHNGKSRGAQSDIAAAAKSSTKGPDRRRCRRRHPRPPSLRHCPAFRSPERPDIVLAQRRGSVLEIEIYNNC